ncbi:NAD(P)H-binding protein [Micromonospora sp. NBC_00898]|uniref:NAD(P)H-binding protein n=1 Tax=Micromonospora sp. NBC_00898 TaxID=2975981 RepID=UPI003864226C|nr:NAD(P)H-binding protein [Micromonospora sp. NBC_00898]
MVGSDLVLIPGAGGVGRTVLDQLRAQDVPVRVMVRSDDDRAAEVRALGADVVLGDLTRPESVAAALEGVGRMYFAMPVSPDHLLAATVVATVAREYGELTALIGMSQLTVSQMTVTSTAESRQQRLHWLAEQVLNWSGLPVVHIRPTSFLDNPLFTTLAAHSIRENGTIALPFGTGRTSPVAVDDVARVVATVLRDPAPHIGQVYELTGPRSVDMTQVAEEYSRALGVPCPMWIYRWTGGGLRCSQRLACRHTPNSTSPPWPDCTARTATTARPPTSNA